MRYALDLPTFIDITQRYAIRRFLITVLSQWINHILPSIVAFLFFLLLLLLEFVVSVFEDTIRDVWIDSHGFWESFVNVHKPKVMFRWLEWWMVLFLDSFEHLLLICWSQEPKLTQICVRYSIYDAAIRFECMAWTTAKGDYTFQHLFSHINVI